MSKASKDSKNELVIKAYIQAFIQGDSTKINILEKKFSKHLQDAFILGKHLKELFDQGTEHKQALLDFYTRVPHHRHKIEEWAIKHDVVELWPLQPKSRHTIDLRDLLATCLRYKRFNVFQYLVAVGQRMEASFPQPDDQSHPEPLHTEHWEQFKEDGAHYGMGTLKLCVLIGDVRSFEYLAPSALNLHHISYAIEQDVDLDTWVFCPANHAVLTQHLDKITQVTLHSGRSKHLASLDDFIEKMKAKCPDAFYEGFRYLLSKGLYKKAEMFEPHLTHVDEMEKAFGDLEISEKALQHHPSLQSLYERYLLTKTVQFNPDLQPTPLKRKI